MHEMRTIVIIDLWAYVSLSVWLSRGFAVQTRLNGSRSCLWWRLLGPKEQLDGFEAAFTRLLWLLVCIGTTTMLVTRRLRVLFVQGGAYDDVHVLPYTPRDVRLLRYLRIRRARHRRVGLRRHRNRVCISCISCCLFVLHLLEPIVFFSEVWTSVNDEFAFNLLLSFGTFTFHCGGPVCFSHLLVVYLVVSGIGSKF